MMVEWSVSRDTFSSFCRPVAQGPALLGSLRTFALIVCAQPFCAGNATVICHASLRLTGPEDKHGVENAGEKKFRPSLLLWIIGDPYFFNQESLTLLTIYKI